MGLVQEWTVRVKKELQEAGFEVRDYQGFPLVELPKEFTETVRLLKFKTTDPADRLIYTEGMLFVPAGCSRFMEQRGAEQRP